MTLQPIGKRGYDCEECYRGDPGQDGGPWTHPSQCCWIARDRKRRAKRRLRWRAIVRAETDMMRAGMVLTLESAWFDITLWGRAFAARLVEEHARPR